MKFRPLHDRVLIRRVDPEGKTTGGIIIPDAAQEKPMEGEIVAVGPGTRDEKGAVVPLDVKPGDRILFGKWSGSERRRRKAHRNSKLKQGIRTCQRKKYVSAVMPAPA
jgi:chaperonin GroES